MPNAIVAPQPIAVEEGAKVLMNGGNAIDAAVTCALVQAILDPQMCGIGGYASLNLHLAADGSNILMDAPALAGEKVSADMWTDRLLRPNPDGWGYFLRDNVNTLGYTSVCTPGTVKALSTMLERWGTISWAEATEPAAAVADEGFMVSNYLANRWKAPRAYPESVTLRDYIEANAEASRIYLREDGAPYDTGNTLRNPDYASTLRHLAEKGAADFYYGELAERMAGALGTHGQREEELVHVRRCFLWSCRCARGSRRDVEGTERAQISHRRPPRCARRAGTRGTRPSRRRSRWWGRTGWRWRGRRLARARRVPWRASPWRASARSR